MQGRLLDYYRAIEDSSEQMLEAARREDWDEVIRCEGDCATLIDQLREKARTEDLSHEDRAEKMRILQRILHNDAEVRTLTEPWHSKFGQLLDPNRLRTIED